ncbi:hypothetical protein FSARC_9998 [Fusarium sarcochroum]|uniref:Methyltransferase domain-containing protein n=1 Tax=Fusarium sarcochroum TaxID=1208366 RepID=A0A8H4X5M1_9HYPO|nr:hypothetical protein FSARC_9998 [Fusarium sarcochroum]
MNQPESDRKFAPKQALTPTPALYSEIVGDGMEQLAAASMSCVKDFGTSEVIAHDVGCGLGAATAAIVASTRGENVAIKGSDINKEVLDIYRQNIVQNKWPAEAFEMDASALKFADETFTHSIGNAVLFVLPSDGVDAIKEMYRTLKPGGVAVLNSWAYTPTIPAIHAAAKKTRPAGTPLPRQGLEKWEDAEFLHDVVIKGGFSPEKVTMEKRNVDVTIGDLKHFSTMVWSFIGGTSSAGWLESDEANWGTAVDTVEEAFTLTDGYEKLEGGKNKIRFVANVAVATK